MPKISQLPAATTPTGAETIPAVQGGITVKIALSQLSGGVRYPCRVATTANITLSGLQTIDGVLLVADDRILVKDQTSASQNGLYVASSSTWSRSGDANASAFWWQGVMVPVNQGTALARTLWMMTTADPITLDSSSLAFSLLAASPTTS